MLRTQAVRAVLFEPMLKALARAHVGPDHLTALSLVAGLTFCPLYVAAPAGAYVALALHVLLDGLDGPLARHLNVASRRGSFTDSMADQVVVTATTLTLMGAGVAGWLPGALYIVTYTVVVLFAMARNALRNPYRWLFRPRFVVFAWAAVETYWWRGTLDYLLWGCSALLAVKAVTGFRGIRRHL